MSALTRGDYDWINLAQCIRGQAARAGIEHEEGTPPEGVVVRMADRIIALESELAGRDPAGAVEEARTYIQRLFPRGLVSLRDVLSDLAVAQGRIARGLHADGRERRRAAIPAEAHHGRQDRLDRAQERHDARAERTA